MITLAYNIDPLLQAAPHLPVQAISDAIPDIILSLPDFRHLAITGDDTLKIDWNAGQNDAESVDSQFTNGSIHTNLPLELVKLKTATRFWQNPSTVHKKALLQLLQSNQVKLWITTDPQAVISANGVRTLLLSTAGWLLNANNFPGKRFGKPVLPVWHQAAVILVPHQADREALLAVFPQLTSVIKVIYPALEEPVQPLTWSEQEQLKLRYTGGRDFFLYAGELSSSAELVYLLKAYSLVKKWLMTGMPLIIAGPATDWTPTFEKMLLTYKYRSDVSVFPDLSQKDLKELVAGAYTLVHPASTTTETYSIQWAFFAGTPVIASESRAMVEFSREAVQLSPPDDIDQLANAMMVLYKDEYLRSSLISKGQERAAIQNRENTLLQYKAVIIGLLGENG